MTSEIPDQTFVPALIDNSPPDENSPSIAPSVQEVTPQKPDRVPQVEPVHVLPFHQLGEYRILRKLGSGGMGDVYLGEQRSLDRLVAIKTLRPELSRNQELVARFLREARSMARLDHPNMVRCHAVGCEGETHFLALEFIDGQSLRQILFKHGPLSLENTLCIARCCAEVLLHAHEQDFIHRDIKPDNILISRKGQVKISDFGLVKALDDNVELTQSGMGMGTPLYMPLEQIQNAKRVDHRADIYALGATLYHCLCNRPPYAQSTLVELIDAKQKGSFPPIRKRNPRVPERLELILDKMLAREAQHRYQDLTDFLRDLDRLGSAPPLFEWPENRDDNDPSAMQPRAIPNNTVLLGSDLDFSSGSKSDFNLSGSADSVPTRLLSAEIQPVVLAKTQPLGDAPRWQVSYINSSGTTEFKTLTEEDLASAVRRRQIPLTADAKPVGGTGFRKISQYPQFRDLGTLVDTLNFAAADLIRKQEETAAIRHQAETPPFYQQTWFFSSGLVLLLAGIVWLAWPLSPQQKFTRGEALFATGQFADQMSAIERYFQPLVLQAPDSNLALLAQERIDEFDAGISRKRIEKKRARGTAPESEPERQYLDATKVREFGDRARAFAMLKSLLDRFQNNPEFRPVMLLAREDWSELKGEIGSAPDSRSFLQSVLQEAETASSQLQMLAAQETWRTVTELYAYDPTCTDIVEYASQKLKNQPTTQTLEELFPLPEPAPTPENSSNNDPDPAATPIPDSPPAESEQAEPAAAPAGAV